MKAIAFVPAHNSPGKRDVTGAFLPECQSFMRVHGAALTDVHEIDNSLGRPARRRQVLRALERYSGHGLGAVAFFCHGRRHSMQFGFSSTNVSELAEAIKAACESEDPIVPLYLCSVGGGHGGGSDSFADALRDALCAAGAVHCRVMAHATRGHTTRNPAALFFEGDGSPIGGSGGYWVVDRQSAHWRKWVRALCGQEKGLEELRYRFPFMAPRRIRLALGGTGADTGVAEATRTFQPLSAGHVDVDVYTVVDRNALIRGGPTAFESTGRRIPRHRRVRVLDERGRHRRVVGLDGRDYQWTRASNLHLFHRDRAALLRVSLPATAPMDVASQTGAKERKLLALCNRTGGLMSTLATELRIDLGAAYAVWMVESAGRKHTPGRALIRFENHLFYRRWGKNNEVSFNRLFRFGGHRGPPGKPWIGHLIRLNGTWSETHASQDNEYRSLALARSLSDDATALSCISIGGPQILISNHRRLGYPTAREMFDAFQESERFHILGFFDFCNGPAFDGKLVKPLRDRDFLAFARGYNGSGKAELYGDRIQECFDMAQSLGLSA